MENHSLRGYLKRRTTEELDVMLAYYLRKENYANYEYAIPEILSVLQERQESKKRDESPETRASGAATGM